MLINGRYAEELRMAVVEDGVLQSYRVEVAEAGVERGNIYRGLVQNVEGSLDAAFVDYGVEKHGFLTRHDVVEEAYHRREPEGTRITDLLQKGRPILVQVEKDAVGSKGASLTSNVSLAGRYLVLQPFESIIGLSRKVEDEEIRRKLKEKVKGLVAGEGFGFIVRTNAVDQTKTALKADLDELVKRWHRVREAFEAGSGPALLHDDQDLVVQALRDHLDASIDEVLIDDQALFARAREYMDAVMPKSKTALTHYSERIPLFSRFNLEPQVAGIYKRTVPLPSGGSIVVEPTEALTAIDVNSGKATSGGSQEETALATNLEAAVEVARQLRLRDLGGLVVVDFIDLRTPKRRRQLEKAVKDAMKADKARSNVGHLSANGLLEINRQRIGRALQMRTHRACPTCGGTGRLQAPELLGLNLLRRIEAGAATGRMRRARVALHPQTAEAVQNRLRQQLSTVESTFRIAIELVSASDLAPSEDRIQWTEREPAPGEAGAGSVEHGPDAPRGQPDGAPRAAEPDGMPRGRREERARGRREAGARGRREERARGRGELREKRPKRRRGGEPEGSRPDRPDRPGARPAEDGPPAPQELAAARPEPVASRAETVAEGEGAGSADPRSRRRRRRRRRPQPDAPQSPPTDLAGPALAGPAPAGPAPAPRAPEEPRPGEGEPAAREDPEAASARRRRRRRGGRKRRHDGEGAPSEPAKVEPSADPPEPAE
jgi:ribonuclease E